MTEVRKYTYTREKTLKSGRVVTQVINRSYVRRPSKFQFLNDNAEISNLIDECKNFNGSDEKLLDLKRTVLSKIIEFAEQEYPQHFHKQQLTNYLYRKLSKS